jgi:hypothetical protein
MLEAAGTFGNDTNVFPAFMGPTNNHGEPSYALYDTAKGTTVFPCLWEQDEDARAQWMMGGAGTTFINPNCGSFGTPIFEIGAGLENGKIIGINARRGTMRAPIIAAAGRYEGDLAAGGEPWWLTIHDAHAWVANVIGHHPRIRFLNIDPAAESRHTVAGLPWIGGAGTHAQTIEILNSNRFPVRWTDWGGFAGIDGMVQDASVPTGHVVYMRAGANRGWYRLLQVGRHVHPGDWLRVVVRHRNSARLTRGSWLYAIARNGVGVANGALAASTAYVNTSFSYRVADLDAGQTLGIGIHDAGANAELNIDSVTIAICAGSIADTNGASLRELEIEVNRLKALLRSTNHMAG